MSRTDFWARRKAAVEAEEAAEAQAAEAQVLDAEREALEAKTDEEVLAELNLPDPDHLKPGDDIRGFMGQAVPDRLRRRALRQLWKLNPVLANVDGLVDYGEDFTDSALVVENLQTAYQVGKGMLAHIEEMARQAAEKEADADARIAAVDDTDADDSDDDSDTGSSLQAAEDTDILTDRSPQADAPTSPDQIEDSGAMPETQENQSDTRFAAVSRRRMRFAFDG